jgi:tellurite resistance-related uncharacterized protein
MKQLPRNIQTDYRTPTFTQDTVPSGLLYRHITKEGYWAKINILYGNLIYRILAPEVEEVRLCPSHSGVVEPMVLYQIQMTGPVAFYVQFYRA